MLQAQERGANAIVELHRELPPYEVARKIPLHARTIRLVGKAVKISDTTSKNNKNLGNAPNAKN